MAPPIFTAIFDCTASAEFLDTCVTRTVEYNLRHEIDYLRRHDDALRRIMDAFLTPDRVADNLVAERGVVRH